MHVCLFSHRAGRIRCTRGPLRSPRQLHGRDLPRVSALEHSGARDEGTKRLEPQTKIPCKETIDIPMMRRRSFLLTPHPSLQSANAALMTTSGSLDVITMTFKRNTIRHIQIFQTSIFKCFVFSIERVNSN